MDSDRIFTVSACIVVGILIGALFSVIWFTEFLPFSREVKVRPSSDIGQTWCEKNNVTEAWCTLPFSTWEGSVCIYIGLDGNETIRTMEDFREMNDYYTFYKYKLTEEQICPRGNK